MADHLVEIIFVSIFTVSDPSHYQPRGKGIMPLLARYLLHLYEAPRLLIMSSISISRIKTSYPLAGLERESKKPGVGR